MNNKTEAVVAENQTKERPRRNRDEKLRKKEDKCVDHLLSTFHNFNTTEEKLGAMCQKYAEMFDDHKILQNTAKTAEKKNSILQKEKEQLQAEHSKAILTKSRLETLCRELQRQNKAVKEECMLKIREEEEKKREIATKFQSTLTELGNLLAQNNDKNAKLRDDNLDMTAKLKNVCDQYEKKEQHVEKMAKQMQLEMQLANTKLAKAKMEMALEKESLLRDNQQLLLELKEYKTQLEEMKSSEIMLRSQIQLYNDKYDEFHKALLQSNDSIGSFKQEVERMAKQIHKLEKETVAWKDRYETTHRTLLKMTEEKIKSDETASVSERRLQALQGLCRTLQAQCTHLREVVKKQAAAAAVPSPTATAATTTTTTATTTEKEEEEKKEDDVDKTTAATSTVKENDDVDKTTAATSTENNNNQTIEMENNEENENLIELIVTDDIKKMENSKINQNNLIENTQTTATTTINMENCENQKTINLLSENLENSLKTPFEQNNKQDKININEIENIKISEETEIEENRTNQIVITKSEEKLENPRPQVQQGKKNKNKRKKSGGAAAVNS